ncbi:MAG: hypothetical protein ABWY27_15640, partial [Telluria sp.]
MYLMMNVQRITEDAAEYRRGDDLEAQTLGAQCAGSWRLHEDVEGAGANAAALSINRTGNGRVARPTVAHSSRYSRTARAAACTAAGSCCWAMDDDYWSQGRFIASRVYALTAISCRRCQTAAVSRLMKVQDPHDAPFLDEQRWFDNRRRHMTGFPDRAIAPLD